MSKSAMATYSELESRRFGYRVFRGNADHIDPQQTLIFLLNNEVDIAILRLPSMHTDIFAALNELGMPYIVADTLVHYHCNLSTYEPKTIMNKDLSFEATTERDVPVIDELVSSIFRDYTNHYYANPFMKKKDILEGYKEWVRNYITGKQSGRLSWVVKKSNQLAGFITCSFENDLCEGVLYGVRSELAGGGVYSDYIRFSQNYFKKKGFKTMKVSTQVHNFAVQKVWAREGFYMREAFNTIHLNSFLQKSILPGYQHDLKGGEISSCLEPGFVVSSFSRYKLKPAKRFFVTNSSCRYLKIIDEKAHYTGTLNVPYADTDSSYYKLFQKVTDTDGNICLVAYYDVHEVK